MYAILEWWGDCADSEDDLIINPIDDKLKNDLDDEDGRIILTQIQDYEEYFNFCFQDHDFLPSQLSNMVILYLENPKLVELFFGYDDLNEYVDLMECDLRERYLEVRHKKKVVIKDSLADNIVSEMIYTIWRFQKRIAHFENRDEVQITADLQDAVEGILNNKYGLIIS